MIDERTELVTPTRITTLSELFDDELVATPEGYKHVNFERINNGHIKEYTVVNAHWHPSLKWRVNHFQTVITTPKLSDSRGEDAYVGSLLPIGLLEPQNVTEAFLEGAEVGREVKNPGSTEPELPWLASGDYKGCFIKGMWSTNQRFDRYSPIFHTYHKNVLEFIDRYCIYSGMFITSWYSTSKSKPLYRIYLTNPNDRRYKVKEIKDIGTTINIYSNDLLVLNYKGFIL